MSAARLLRLYALRTQREGEAFEAAMARAAAELPTIAALAANTPAKSPQ